MAATVTHRRSDSQLSTPSTPSSKATDRQIEEVDKEQDVRVKEAPVTEDDFRLLSEEERKAGEARIKRMLDMRLMPMTIIIFLLNYIDRTAVTAARLQGLQTDLNLTDLQYETIIAILYASYVPAQIPSNMVSPFLPGDSELSFRAAILYGGLLISNAFGSGAITICVGFVAMWALPDYPHNTRWMTPAERRLAQVRLAEDAGEADEDSESESALYGLKLALKDPKVYILAVMTCSQLLGLSFVNFFPTLTQTLATLLMLMVVRRPPWILATIVTCVNAWHTDKTGERYFHINVPWWGVIVGYIIGLSTMNTGGRYVCMFLMASGYAGFALTLVWVSNAIPRPPAKRSVAMGIVNGFGNIGNLIGSFVWKASWGPEYHPAMIISLASLAFASFLAFIVRCMLIRDNKALEAEMLDNMDEGEKIRIADAARLEGITFQEALDRKRGFRYLY
ncbi:MFS general substrate transporter [Gloeophyllum trabeum ATCC 11539]|uniref:MFS general substrate transporter n=1 Tax=Gloeophyllum trabeum (strain ATCC 11539 / FP-39264 / Madison 617) TaxID=670483 RepID=S7Q4T4_GLOTA|nr:MFS general substrate transporter [Gloeophyllum trabeum ATCC 11539]EPQ55026.1 MFS general substrate transporter [Gloeophyllum trabeum ATCC 11539]